jgi:hypothetical protein
MHLVHANIEIDADSNADGYLLGQVTLKRGKGAGRGASNLVFEPEEFLALYHLITTCLAINHYGTIRVVD